MSKKPLSVRLEEPLIEWLSSADVPNAASLSDKVREAVKLLQLAHGSNDFRGALHNERSFSKGLRQDVRDLEQLGHHSEVMATLLEYVPGLSATMHVERVLTLEQASDLESKLVKKVFDLAAALLRQAVISDAPAFDPKVIVKHSSSIHDASQAVRQRESGRKDKHV